MDHAERREVTLARVAVSYAILARSLVGAATVEEASEYHLKGLVTDEVLFFIAECGDQAGNPSLEALAPREAYIYYLEAAVRSGFRGFAGIPLESLASFLVFLSALAEAELRGDDSVSGVRLRIYEEVLPSLLEPMKATSNSCYRTLAAAVESVAREDMELLGG
ncbi:hypothetical protein [Stetteria hydrogenophila]